MSSTRKIKLTAWAAGRYDPAPSVWVLRKWVRDGQIHPPPELVGKHYYVDPNARRITGAELPNGRSLVERLKAATA